jgi:hypothetical protein
MLGFVLQSFSREEPLYDRCFPIAYDKLLVPYPVYHTQIVTSLENAIQLNTIILMGSRLGPILTASGGVECIEVE